MPDELELLARVTDGIPGEWAYTPATASDRDSVRFFQKTRVFTLQHFIRLLDARHRFSELLESLGGEGMAGISEQRNGMGEESQDILHQITQCEFDVETM